MSRPQISPAGLMVLGVGIAALAGLVGVEWKTTRAGHPPGDDRPDPGSRPPSGTTPFLGDRGGDEREVGGVKLCWCPPGRFLMGSPRGEPERRPDETQVEVTLTRGFWAGKYETTQGQWKRVVGPLPGKPTAGEGDDFPVYDINFAEAEGFCRKLTDQARKTGDLPTGWEFRLPTEALWEYACRAGTTTATAFGDRLSSQQANFQGKPSRTGCGRSPQILRPRSQRRLSPAPASTTWISNRVTSAMNS